MSKSTTKYELAYIKEIGENEAVLTTAAKDYYILLSDEDTSLLEDLLINETIEYVALDTEKEQIIFDNVFGMDNEQTEELADIDYGVDEDGNAE